MSEKEKKFRQLLKDYGVTKCYIDEWFNFETDEPDGHILVNVDNPELIDSLYLLFVKDPDGLVAENQTLIISYHDFTAFDSNYNLEV